MKALIDTNIIIDALQSRADFLEDAREIMLRIADYDGYITTNSISDIHYLQHKFFHDKKRARDSLADLLAIFGILDITSDDCYNALRSNVSDFEDAILVESALRNRMDAIVTRNTKDFKNSPIKVYSPYDFLQVLDN